jgi:hypothetical protein
MIDAIEQEYDEEADLLATIDKNLQVGATAGKIYVAQATNMTLIKLLIDKGIFTSEEFVEIIKEKEKKLNESINNGIAQIANPSAQELKDSERFLEAVTDGFDAICKKVSE